MDKRTYSPSEPSNKHYLETALTKKLVSGSERELNNTSEFSQLFRGVGFDIRNALETMSSSKSDGDQNIPQNKL